MKDLRGISQVPCHLSRYVTCQNISPVTTFHKICRKPADPRRSKLILVFIILLSIFEHTPTRAACTCIDGRMAKALMKDLRGMSQVPCHLSQYVTCHQVSHVTTCHNLSQTVTNMSQINICTVMTQRMKRKGINYY